MGRGRGEGRKDGAEHTGWQREVGKFSRRGVPGDSPRRTQPASPALSAHQPYDLHHSRGREEKTLEAVPEFDRD